jgi:hypothetical protein
MEQTLLASSPSFSLWLRAYFAFISVDVSCASNGYKIEIGLIERIFDCSIVQMDEFSVFHGALKRPRWHAPLFK